MVSVSVSPACKIFSSHPTMASKTLYNLHSLNFPIQFQHFFPPCSLNHLLLSEHVITFLPSCTYCVFPLVWNAFLLYFCALELHLPNDHHICQIFPDLSNFVCFLHSHISLLVPYNVLQFSHNICWLP